MTPSGTTHYVYDRNGHLLAEFDGGGNPLTEYVWFDDMPLAIVANLDTASPLIFTTFTSIISTDQVMMTDASKTTVWQADYWPFGQVYGITGGATNNLRFPGQYFLLESGLDYNWYRHYDETIGRYVQPDPLGFVNGPSVYAYAKSPPEFSVDATGTQTVVLPAPLCAASPLACAALAAVVVAPAVYNAAQAVINYCKPSPSTGNCTPDQHRRLQDAVDNRCGAALACNSTDTAEELSEKIGQHSRCIDARHTINDVRRLAAQRYDRLQSAINLALGSALATIGLTIPAVAVVSIVLGTPLTLGLSSKEEGLRALSLCWFCNDARYWPHYDTTGGRTSGDTGSLSVPCGRTLMISGK